MDRFLNFNLLSNPFNWVIVFLMVVFAMMGAHLVVSAVKGGAPPAKS